MMYKDFNWLRKFLVEKEKNEHMVSRAVGQRTSNCYKIVYRHLSIWIWHIHEDYGVFGFWFERIL